jgi:hypothetical protein
LGTLRPKIVLQAGPRPAKPLRDGRQINYIVFICFSHFGAKNEPESPRMGDPVDLPQDDCPRQLNEKRGRQGRIRNTGHTRMMHMLMESRPKC